MILRCVGVSWARIHTEHEQLTKSLDLDRHWLCGMDGGRWTMAIRHLFFFFCKTIGRPQNWAHCTVCYVYTWFENEDDRPAVFPPILSLIWIAWKELMNFYGRSVVGSQMVVVKKKEEKKTITTTSNPSVCVNGVVLEQRTLAALAGLATLAGCADGCEF